MTFIISRSLDPGLLDWNPTHRKRNGGFTLGSTEVLPHLHIHIQLGLLALRAERHRTIPRSWFFSLLLSAMLPLASDDGSGCHALSHTCQGPLLESHGGCKQGALSTLHQCKAPFTDSEFTKGGEPAALALKGCGDPALIKQLMLLS